jgi:hypothetical protein
VLDWYQRLIIKLMTNTDTGVTESSSSLLQPVLVSMEQDDDLLRKFFSFLLQLCEAHMKPAEHPAKSIKTLITKPVLTAMITFGVSLLERFKIKYVGRDETVALYQKSSHKKKSAELAAYEMKIEAMVGLIEVFTQLATFADAQDDDWYKHALVDLGALEWCLDLLFQLKKIVEQLEEAKLFNSQQAGPSEESKEHHIDKHPFAAFNSRIVALACPLTYRRTVVCENYFQSEAGKLRLGCLLSYTKLDVDAPMLREWCLMVIRNLCSWSDKIRENLKGLELIEVSPAGQQTLAELGLEEMFRKEMEKLMKKDKDGKSKLEPGSINFSTVDF